VGNQRGLQELFILAQDYQLELRTEYGIPRTLKLAKTNAMTVEDIVRACLVWLPHMWSTSKLEERWELWEEELLWWWELLLWWWELRSTIPEDIVSSCASHLAESESATNFHSVLCVIAGVFMVADRMFWTSNREVARPDQAALLSETQAALALYQSVDKEVVTSAIRERFSSSLPADWDEVKAIGERLTELVQERCHTARPGRA